MNFYPKKVDFYKIPASHPPLAYSNLPHSFSTQLVATSPITDTGNFHSRQISEPFKTQRPILDTSPVTLEPPVSINMSNDSHPITSISMSTTAGKTVFSNNIRPPQLQTQTQRPRYNNDINSQNPFLGGRPLNVRMPRPVAKNGIPKGGKPHGKATNLIYEAMGSMLSSDLDSTSFFDSEDEVESSRFSTTTCNTYSSNYFHKFRFQKRRKVVPRISRASSFSSITESTLSLDVIQVILNMEPMQFLGISIVGQPNTKNLDGGIYVGNIMKGGAVHQDGRIQPGDMILEVNGISFDSMDNDEAVRTLREQVQRAGPIRLTVAKSWTCRDHLRVPQEEPVRPIDPRAWILHTNAVREASALLDPDIVIPETPPPKMVSSGSGNLNVSESRLTLTAGVASGTSTSSCSLPECERILALQEDFNNTQVSPKVSTPACQQTPPAPVFLNTSTDYLTIVRAMMTPESGLEVRDRTWLKICIPKAFIGSDLVDWLFVKVDGFNERREAKKFSCQLLRSGLIRHTVNKSSFSEQCYYVFADIPSTNGVQMSKKMEAEKVAEKALIPPPGATVLLPPPVRSFSFEKIDKSAELHLMRRPEYPSRINSVPAPCGSLSRRVQHHPPSGSVAATAGGSVMMSSSGSGSSQQSCGSVSMRPGDMHQQLQSSTKDMSADVLASKHSYRLAMTNLCT